MKMKGVSGILRIKNDGMFIERCINSCIDALDQLVVVYNDCSDDSETQIEKMWEKYPDKIDVFEYKPQIYGANLSKEEFEIAVNLPDDSPHLLCNYYNFALSKAKYEYALKIDADQIYFTKELKKWCDFCRECPSIHYSLKVLMGQLFQKYFSLYRWLSIKSGRVLPMLPQKLISKFYPVYIEFAKYLFVKDKACLSMAGINVFEDKNTFVSLGSVKDEINILPPFNGEGDHLIFKISEYTRYVKFEMPYYNTMRSSSYSLIEEFKHPYRVMFLGFFWIHISSMRPNVTEKVKSVRKKFPNVFISLEDFLRLNFRDIDAKTDKRMFRLFQRILFSFVYTANKEQLKRSIL